MKPTSLEQLSDPVLMDILAALPMWAAVRLAQLGHKRLKDISCRPWVLMRMTEVNFPTAVKAYQAGARVRKAFCSEAVLRRLYGRISNLPYQRGKRFPRGAVGHIMKKVPGRIHCEATDKKILEFLWDSDPDVRDKVIFMTEMNLYFMYIGMTPFPNLIACSYADTTEVLYRPSRLHGRHVVDVLRTACKLYPDEEARLDHIRRKATENAREEDAGVLRTSWLIPPRLNIL